MTRRAGAKSPGANRRRNAAGDILAAIRDAQARLRLEVRDPSRGKRRVLASRASEAITLACRELSALLDDLDGKVGPF